MQASSNTGQTTDVLLQGAVPTVRCRQSKPKTQGARVAVCELTSVLYEMALITTLAITSRVSSSTTRIPSDETTTRAGTFSTISPSSASEPLAADDDAPADVADARRPPSDVDDELRGTAASAVERRLAAVRH